MQKNEIELANVKKIPRRRAVTSPMDRNAAARTHTKWIERCKSIMLSRVPCFDFE